MAMRAGLQLPLLLLLLPGLLGAASPPETAEGSCVADGACGESEVERAEELEASALRVELLQQSRERHVVRTAVVASGQVASSEGGAESAAAPPAQGGENLTEVPDDEMPDSVEGPYDEVPSEEEAARPRPAIEGWDAPAASTNSTNADLGWFGGRSSFCQSHHTGYFCRGTTRTRCCKKSWFYEECGTTVHSTYCGWHGEPDHPYHPGYPGGGYPGGGYPGGGHPGWHAWNPPGGYNHFCETHHTGNFCSHHTRISCCKSRGWHYVSCTTTTRSHSYC